VNEATLPSGKREEKGVGRKKDPSDESRLYFFWVLFPAANLEGFVVLVEKRVKSRPRKTHAGLHQKVVLSLLSMNKRGGGGNRFWTFRFVG